MKKYILLIITSFTALICSAWTCQTRGSESVEYISLQNKSTMPIATLKFSATSIAEDLHMNKEWALTESQFAEGDKFLLETDFIVMEFKIELLDTDKNIVVEKKIRTTDARDKEVTYNLTLNPDKTLDVETTIKSLN